MLTCHSGDAIACTHLLTDRSHQAAEGVQPGMLLVYGSQEKKNYALEYYITALSLYMYGLISHITKNTVSNYGTVWPQYDAGTAHYCTAEWYGPLTWKSSNK